MVHGCYENVDEAEYWNDKIQYIKGSPKEEQW